MHRIYRQVKLGFAALALIGFAVGNVQADVQRASAVKAAEIKAEAKKSCSGKWAPATPVAVETERVQGLIEAHQVYGSGFTPLLPKFSVSN